MFRSDKARARNLLVLIGAVAVVAVAIIVIRLVSQPPANFNDLPRCHESPALANGFMVFQASRNANNAELVRASLSGADLCRLTQSEGLVEGMPDIAPDGSSILFSYHVVDTSTGVELGVYRMNLDGTNPVPLEADFFENVGHPASSPNGERIVFSATIIESALPENLDISSGDDIAHDLFVMSSEGEFLAPLVNAPSRQLEAAWSPDGTRIAFSQTDTSILPFDLYVINADGGDPLLLAAATGSQPSWSPDSGQLVAEGMNGLIIVHADDGNVTTLTEDHGKSPVWAADGNIYYVLDGSVQRIQPDGSGRTALTPAYGIGDLDVWMPET
jgi:Tol biopolymer transport system component